jgi:hypothetical protein
VPLALPARPLQREPAQADAEGRRGGGTLVGSPARHRRHRGEVERIERALVGLCGSLRATAGGQVPILNGKEIQPALASSTRRMHACARTTGFLACTHLADRCHEQARVGKPGQPRDWQSVAWYFAPRLQLQQPRSQILQPRRERTLRWPRQLHPRQWHLPEREGGLNGTHGFGAKLAALQSGAKLAGQKNKHRRSRICWLMPPSPAIVL